MGLNYERLMAYRPADIAVSYGERECILYALGIGLGMDPLDPGALKFVYERAGLQAFPTMAVVLGWPGRLTDPAFGVDERLVVAGDLKVVLHRPLPAQARLVSRPRIKEVIDKGAGNAAIILNTRDLLAEDGTPVATVDSSTFARKHGGFGGKVTETPAPPPVPQTAPDEICDLPTPPNLALLYRLNGDENPLHADPERAKVAGFDRPILHGAASFGVAGACDPAHRRGLPAGAARQHRGAVLASRCFPARPSAPRCGWRATRVSFQCRVAGRDDIVLSNGLATLEVRVQLGQHHAVRRRQSRRPRLPRRRCATGSRRTCRRSCATAPTRIDPPELKPWHRKLYERGWIAPHWPKEHGGMGATLTQQIILFEEISRVGAPTPYPHGLNFIGPLIIDAGTPEQKAKHLPPILTGEATWCQGYSESGAGSDLASLTTRAELDGDHFIVNGHKMWTTNGHFADWMFALVRTDPKAQPRHAGISMLLIDLKSPGITVRPIQTIKGDAEFAEEFFVDVRVPRENMLGGLNDGWKVANRLLGLRALHHRTSAQRRGAAQQGAAGGGAHRRDARAGVPAEAGRARDRPAGVLRLLPPRGRAARRKAGAVLDGAGDQDRRRRARPARVGASGRGGGRIRPARR